MPSTRTRRSQLKISFTETIGSRLGIIVITGFQSSIEENLKFRQFYPKLKSTPAVLNSKAKKVDFWALT